MRHDGTARHGRDAPLLDLDEPRPAGAGDSGGTDGPDAIRVQSSGLQLVLAGAGDDAIRARDVGPSLLDGGADDDVVRL